MQRECPACEASVEEIGVSTCPNCGAKLGEVIFPEMVDEGLDTHGLTGRVVSITRAASFAESNGLGPDGLDFATDEEEATLAALMDSTDCHPSNEGAGKQAKRQLPDPHFFCFRLNLGGDLTDFWVRSHKKTPARKALDKHTSGMDLRNHAGERAPWGLAGPDLAIAYREAMPLVEDRDTLPTTAKGYLDAYGEELQAKPRWVRVTRT